MTTNEGHSQLKKCCVHKIYPIQKTMPIKKIIKIRKPNTYFHIIFPPFKDHSGNPSHDQGSKPCSVLI
jgi:hypothetical protein